MSTVSMTCNLPTIPYAIQRVFSAFQLQVISRADYCEKIAYVLSLAAGEDQQPSLPKGRFPVGDESETCECCGVRKATHYEHPIVGDVEFKYYACDPCWKEHDEEWAGMRLQSAECSADEEDK